MKTYTHANGNVYNISIEGQIVILTSVTPMYVAPMQITLENWNKLQPTAEVITVKSLTARNKMYVGKSVELTVLSRYEISDLKMTSGRCVFKGINYLGTITEGKFGRISFRMVKEGRPQSNPVWFDEVEIIK